MKSILCRAAAPAALLLFAGSVAAEPASSDKPHEHSGEHAHHAGHAAHDQHADHAGHDMDHSGHDMGHGTTEAQPAPQAQEAERVCRHVKLDMSSRRKTKVCKTADEWREFNQRR